MSNLKGLINLSIDSKPRVVWCFDRQVISNLKKYPSYYARENKNKLMGIDIEVVDEPSCKLKYIFSNGQEISFDYDFDYEDGFLLPSDLMEKHLEEMANHFKKMNTQIINAQSFCLINDGTFLNSEKDLLKRAREIRANKEQIDEM